ncbi:hypothetical protein SBADM41S_01071 [Streptomyces badius]
MTLGRVAPIDLNSPCTKTDKDVCRISRGRIPVSNARSISDVRAVDLRPLRYRLQPGARLLAGEGVRPRLPGQGRDRAAGAGLGLRRGAAPRDPVQAALPATGHPGIHRGERAHDHHRVPRHGTGPDQGLALGRHHTAPLRARRHRLRSPRLRRSAGIDLPRGQRRRRKMPHQRTDGLVHRAQPRRRPGHARRRPHVPRRAAPGRRRRVRLRPAPHLRPAPGRRLQQGLQEPHVPLRQQQRHRAPDAPAGLHPRQRPALHRLPWQGDEVAARLAHRPGEGPHRRRPGTGQ